MTKQCVWVHTPQVQQILEVFITPKTPRCVEAELNIPKLRLKKFLKENLLVLLNSNAKKGKLYTLTTKARRLLDVPIKRKINCWNEIGWLVASPKQRTAVIQSMDSNKRTSESIRIRSARYNPRFTRISIKKVLHELVKKGLISTELNGRKRYYWLSEKGLLIKSSLEKYLNSNNL